MCRRFGSSCGLHIQRERMFPEIKPVGFFEKYISNNVQDVAFQNTVAAKQTAMFKLLAEKLLKDTQLDNKCSPL
jgi:hypothetical protein